MPATRSSRRGSLLAACVTLALLAGFAGGLLATCGPFTDVAADAFCPFVLEVFYLGITTGTTPTTYDPTGNVSRLQMAAFLSRTVDGVLKRGSRRAAMNRFWVPGPLALDLTTVGAFPNHPAADGADIWVPTADSTVVRVRASDGRLLETWTGATTPVAALSANGKVFVTGETQPGALYRIDPRLPAGSVTTVASNLGKAPFEMAYDGTRVWTANISQPGSVSIVTPSVAIPWTVTTVTAAEFPAGGLIGALFDGSYVWVTGDRLFKLDPFGAVLLTVTVGINPYLPIYDGTNIWVPNQTSNTVSVVRASSGVLLATLTGNGLNSPFAAGFDGERILVTNDFDLVSMWKAADFSEIGSFSTGASTNPRGVCSDGINFWVTLRTTGKLTRF